MKAEPPPTLYAVRHACKVLGVSYPALKQWIYKGKIKTIKTPGGHHRIPATEIDRLLPPVSGAAHCKTAEKTTERSATQPTRRRIVDLKIEGLMAQVTLSIAGQHLTSIITADAVREMRLEKAR